MGRPFAPGRLQVLADRPAGRQDHDRSCSRLLRPGKDLELLAFPLRLMSRMIMSGPYWTALQYFFSAKRAVDARAIALEGLRQGGRKRRIVVDDQDWGFLPEADLILSSNPPRSRTASASAP